VTPPAVDRVLLVGACLVLGLLMFVAAVVVGLVWPHHGLAVMAGGGLLVVIVIAIGVSLAGDPPSGGH
jgi:hypothetical protein